jgi:beta-phosphoglucomutase-like phosphatase (HAD superfamily)
VWSPVGLVTNAGTSWLTNTLTNTPLGQFFGEDNIFGREEGEPKKPSPTAYMKAFARFRPSVCIAYEDTPRGVEAARAARADMVIGLASSEHHREDMLLDAGASVVYSDYRQIPVFPLER